MVVEFSISDTQSHPWTERGSRVFISSLPAPCVSWMAAAPASCRLPEVLWCTGMLMAAPAEAPHGLLAPIFGSDTGAGFKII